MNFSIPRDIAYGEGSLSRLKDLKGKKAALVTGGQSMKKLGFLAQAEKHLQDAGMETIIVDGVEPNPSVETVKRGAKEMSAFEPDWIVAIGGGSALDAAKAVALMVGQNAPLWDFEDIGDNWTRVNEAGVAPIVAVPTTAGTGSEVGRASVITDEENHVKRIIFHPLMLPSVVILDPQLTLGLTSHITAATGMDALSHSLEALCSPFYHPMAEGIAIEGIRLVKEYLPRAVADGTDIEARMQMLVASSMGATAFQKGLGGMHAIAHSLGALYGAHHGLLNAILMPYVLKANRVEIEERIERLSRYLNFENCSFDGFLNWVLDMRTKLEIPHSLSMISIDSVQSELVGKMSEKDPSAGGNPIQFSAEQYSQIFVDAVKGNID